MEFCDPHDSRRAAVGARHRRARRADFPDLDLRTGRARASTRASTTRGPTTRPAPGSKPCSPTSRASARGGLRLGPGRGKCGAPGLAQAGRRDRRPARRLRRHLPAADKVFRAARLRHPASRRRGRHGARAARCRTERRGWSGSKSPTNPRLLVYDIAAIAAAAHAHGALRRRRQHICDAALPAAVPARRRHRRAQRDEVPGGPLRSDPGRGPGARRQRSSSRSSSCRTRSARSRRRSTAG